MQTPLISLSVGQRIQVDTLVMLGDAVDLVPILVTNGNASAIAAIEPHPTNPRAVIVSGLSGGRIGLWVSSTPSAVENLEILIEVRSPPAVRRIVYVTHGPVDE